MSLDDVKLGPPGDNSSGGGRGGGGGGGGGHIGFEGYGGGFDGPGMPSMTGGSMGYAYPPPSHVSESVQVALSSYYLNLPNRSCLN